MFHTAIAVVMLLGISLGVLYFLFLTVRACPGHLERLRSSMLANHCIYDDVTFTGRLSVLSTLSGLAFAVAFFGERHLSNALLTTCMEFSMGAGVTGLLAVAGLLWFDHRTHQALDQPNQEPTRIHN